MPLLTYNIYKLLLWYFENIKTDKT